MTEKEAALETRKLMVKSQEIKLRDAHMKLAQGTLKAQAEYDERVELLRSDIAREELELAKQKIWLAEDQARLERGFDA